MSNLKCFVPNCMNMKQDHPQKSFFYVRDCLKKKWCQQARVTYDSKHKYYCCEDHLNLEEDLENFYYWKFMKGRPIIKPTANLKLNTNYPIQPLEVQIPGKNNEDDSELKKLLIDKENILLPYKVQETAYPAASKSVFEYDVGVQCKTSTANKSTNYVARKPYSDLRSAEATLASPSTSSATLTASETTSMSGWSSESGSSENLTVREQPARALPGRSKKKIKSGAKASFAKRDPLNKSTTDQCRFCAEFSEDCVSIVNRPYLSTNRTALAFNDVIVQIDFNDQTLPKTVCKDCDAELQDMFDFVRVVKNAQRFLINVEVDERVNVDIEVNQPETLFVKTECEDSNGENDGKNDRNYENDDDVDDGKDDSNDEDNNVNDEKDDDDEEEESKDGIVDSLTVSETTFIKQSVALKRKSTTSATNLKKANVSERSEEDNELIFDIKEEVIEKDTNDGDNNRRCVIGTGTDDKPSEIELLRKALVFEMISDSASGFS